MAIYKVKSFSRFARKNAMPDASLSTAAREVLDGDYEADLGGGVYKTRVARKGGGKSGGFRTFITHKTSDHLFFVYGFPKNERDDIDERERKALKKMATALGGLSRAQIHHAIGAGEILEVQDEDDESQRQEARR